MINSPFGLLSLSAPLSLATQRSVTNTHTHTHTEQLTRWTYKMAHLMFEVLEVSFEKEGNVLESLPDTMKGYLRRKSVTWFTVNLTWCFLEEKYNTPFQSYPRPWLWCSRGLQTSLQHQIFLVDWSPPYSWLHQTSLLLITCSAS